MPPPTPHLIAAVETYFADLRRVRASGGATGERSSYGPLEKLLNAVGNTLKPKVFCVGELADQGAGHPDFGLYAAKQVQRGQPKQGQTPERGVVEVKGVDDDAFLTAAKEQVNRYWRRYRLVLVTNTRDFVLVGEDANGKPARLETFRPAESAEEVCPRAGNAARFRPEGGRRAGRISEPCLVASHGPDRAERPGVAARLVCARRAASGRSRGRCPVVECGTDGAGRGAWHSVRGRTRGEVLPFDAGTDAVLRGLLRVGFVGAIRQSERPAWGRGRPARLLRLA